MSRFANFPCGACKWIGCKLYTEFFAEWIDALDKSFLSDLKDHIHHRIEHSRICTENPDDCKFAPMLETGTIIRLPVLATLEKCLDFEFQEGELIESRHHNQPGACPEAVVFKTKKFSHLPKNLIFGLNRFAKDGQPKNSKRCTLPKYLDMDPFSSKFKS